jgi:excinuclease UvrABC helicase subunit UvrB
LFQIKDWSGTVRDTARNLQVFDLVRDHAEDDEDKVYLEQWRPYLLRMNAVAAAMLQIEESEYASALATVQAAVARIEALEELDDETFQFERERSLAALREIASQIEQTKPVSQLERLERELHQAIESQHFEKAAALRDRIRALREGKRS